MAIVVDKEQRIEEEKVIDQATNKLRVSRIGYPLAR
jgi:hypothetical protein